MTSAQPKNSHPWIPSSRPKNSIFFLMVRKSELFSPSSSSQELIKEIARVADQLSSWQARIFLDL